MSGRPAILFVCLGNICRSPLAEAAFRQAAERAGLDVLIDSAGTGDWHVGEPPDPRAQQIALEHGVDISHLRGRQLAPEDYYRFTHIFALDAKNLATIREREPADATAKIGLLLDCVDGRRGEAVADPYFGGLDAFHATWAYVTAAAEALVEKLRG